MNRPEGHLEALSSGCLSRRRGSPIPSLARLTLFATALVLALAAPARADLVLIQDSNGFPGAESDAPLARQKVEIRGDRLRVLDETAGWALYVLLDKKQVIEASATSKTFVERPLSYFDNLRKKRQDTRQEKLQRFLKAIDAAKNKDDDRAVRELEQELTRDGLRADGKTLVRTEWFPSDSSVRHVVIDGKKTVARVEHYKIRENNAARPAFDLWIAPDLLGRAELLKFWRSIGPFSDEVVAELAKLQGLPVEIEASFDDGSFSKTIRSKIHEVRQEDVDAESYELPKGYTARGADEKPAAQKYTCEVCGKQLEQPRVFAPGGKRHFSCPEHIDQLIIKVTDALKKAKAGPPVPHEDRRPEGPPTPGGK